MKICFLLISHWSGNLGGAELQVKYIIDSLKKDPTYQLSYICRKTKLADDDGVKIYKVKHNNKLGKYSHAVDNRQIQETLHTIQPDVIYTRASSAYVGIAADYCQKNQCKLVFHIAHQQDVEKYNASGLSFFIKYLDRKIYHNGIRHADAIIGQAQYQDDLLQKNYQRSCDVVIPNFHPFPDAIIEKEASPIKIYWIANIKEKKRPEKFIALAEAFADQKDVQFVMVGAMQSAYWSEQLPEKLKNIPNLDYKGFLPIEEVNDALGKAHIFVNTSTSEGFPNTFVQAWMREVPVVSLSFDPDDIITRNNLGFVSGDLEQMVKDVKQLIQDQNLREEIGKHARVFAHQQFSLDNIKKITEIFHQLHDANTYIES